MNDDAVQPDLDAVLADYMARLDAGEPVDPEALIAANPELAGELRAHFSDAVAIKRMATNATADFAANATPRSALEVRCPSCHAPMEVAVDTALTDLTCPSCGSHFSLVDQTKATRMAPSLSKMGRFELIERIGVGGFGSVWKARDKELDRTVAVKIPRQGAMTAEEQEKFFREARAAAQLRHPNIVSVHEVGRDGESVYIVSDFVRGVTLGDWLTAQQLTSREAAELCAKIADALHHAHEQGVVHRDLKPANIMIDANGEPHLMDFGLARREAGEVTVTIDGQILGTPAYMSPEQAQGEAHTADRRSDVYSLGVILFQLLTGELPFRGNARMIMHQVINDEPPSPRKLNGNVTKDLETIALKCLEKDPNRRYQTGADLAADLKRYLSGEPILSRPLGRIERGWRWAQQNPRVALLTASVAVLLVAIAALSTAGFTVAKKQQLAAQEAASREAKLRTLAEKNLALAEEAVDAYLTRVAGDERLKQGDFNKLRTSLLETAVPFYERFAKQKPGDAESASNRANAYARLASIHGETGQHQASVSEYTQAILLQKKLVSKYPDKPDYQRDLANHHVNLGWNLHIVGRYPEANPHYETALSLLTKLAHDFPDELAYRQMLSRTHERLGMLLRHSDRIAARTQFERAIAHEKSLIAASPDSAAYQSLLASSSFYLGFLIMDDEREAARGYLAKAADIQRNLTTTYPNEPEYRAALAESLGILGWVLQLMGDDESARRHSEEGLQIQKELVKQFPSVRKYRVVLANIFSGYEEMLLRMGDAVSTRERSEIYELVGEKRGQEFYNVANSPQTDALSASINRFVASPLPDGSRWKVQFFWYESSPFTGVPVDWAATLKQEPLFEESFDRIDFRWKNEAPANGVPADRFATVATAQVHLAAGKYEVQTISDDGVRVWIDDKLVISNWSGHAEAFDNAQISLGSGEHSITIEHFDHRADATLRFNIAPADVKSE